MDVLIAAAALLVADATSVSTIATAGGVTVPAATTAGNLMVNSSAATNIDIVSLTTVQNKISQAGEKKGFRHDHKKIFNLVILLFLNLA